MKFFIELFFPSVEGSLAQFNKAHAKLKEVAKRKKDKAAYCTDKIDELLTERQANINEALRADRIADRIESIIL